MKTLSAIISQSIGDKPAKNNAFKFFQTPFDTIFFGTIIRRNYLASKKLTLSVLKKEENFLNKRIPHEILFSNGENFVREKIFIFLTVLVMFVIQFYELQDLKSSIKNQNSGQTFISADEELKFLSCTVAVEGEGVIIKIDDSAFENKIGANQNLYVVHDDDILRIINELRAAGAEAISINGQRLTATSEIRCAGPTLSVNNVRSAAPFEIKAIGEKKSLANSITMRGGVAETLKIWGIELNIETADKIIIPAYEKSMHHVYAKIIY